MEKAEEDILGSSSKNGEGLHAEESELGVTGQFYVYFCQTKAERA